VSFLSHFQYGLLPLVTPLSSDPNINAILFANAAAIIAATVELPLLLRACYCHSNCCCANMGFVYYYDDGDRDGNGNGNSLREKGVGQGVGEGERKDGFASINCFHF
jgi:hypothetical protein